MSSIGPDESDSDWEEFDSETEPLCSHCGETASKQERLKNILESAVGCALISIGLHLVFG